MSLTSKWEQWEGSNYPSGTSSPTVYFYPQTVDIEDFDNLTALVEEIHMDGVVPSKKAARALLESATVVHALYVKDEDGYTFYTGGDDWDYIPQEGTWVELDEYED